MSELKTLLDNFSEARLKPILDQLKETAADQRVLVEEVRKWTSLLTKILNESQQLTDRVEALENWQQKQAAE